MGCLIVIVVNKLQQEFLSTLINFLDLLEYLFRMGVNVETKKNLSCRERYVTVVLKDNKEIAARLSSYWGT